MITSCIRFQKVIGIISVIVFIITIIVIITIIIITVIIIIIIVVTTRMMLSRVPADLLSLLFLPSLCSLPYSHLSHPVFRPSSTMSIRQTPVPPFASLPSFLPSLSCRLPTFVNNVNSPDASPVGVLATRNPWL